MSKAHYIVFKNADGVPTQAPMKSWLRENEMEIPQGMDATLSTSYQLRRALRKKGWGLEELNDKTLLVKPDSAASIAYADPLLEEEAETEESHSHEESAEEAEITFGLERDLQAALRANITQLETALEIIDGGKERKTEAGFIDITAKDGVGNAVVIELKAGTALPEAVAQILAYMGAIAASDKTPVRGILVAGDFHKKVVWASRAIPNLELKKYAFQFAFEPVI